VNLLDAIIVKLLAVAVLVAAAALPAVSLARLPPEVRRRRYRPYWVSSVVVCFAVAVFVFARSWLSLSIAAFALVAAVGWVANSQGCAICGFISHPFLGTWSPPPENCLKCGRPFPRS
jgi:hypothetical protein